MMVMTRIMKLAAQDHDQFSPFICSSLLEQDWILDTDSGGGTNNLQPMSGGGSSSGEMQFMDHASFSRSFCELAQLWTRSEEETQWAGALCFISRSISCVRYYLLCVPSLSQLLSDSVCLGELQR